MKNDIDNKPQLLGSQLDAKDRAHVLAAYLHRFTGNHKPAWANEAMPNGESYKIQFKDDEEWLNHTYFAVNQKGQLNKSCKECRSNPTWPTTSK